MAADRTLSNDDLDPAAGGGLLHRRVFMRRGLVLSTALAADAALALPPEAGKPADAAGAADPPPWTLQPGLPFTEYGQPSPHSHGPEVRRSGLVQAQNGFPLIRIRPAVRMWPVPLRGSGWGVWSVCRLVGLRSSATRQALPGVGVRKPVHRRACERAPWQASPPRPRAASPRRGVRNATHRRVCKGASGQAAARLRGAEEHRARGRARSALGHLTRRACLNAANAVSAVSCATGHEPEHRKAVGAKRRPPR